MELKENERVDDLQYKGLKIIQNKKAFVSELMQFYYLILQKNEKGTIAVDMCSGTGIIAILLSGKTDVKKFYCIEIQTEVAEMSKRSVSMNGLEDRIIVINEDINKVKDEIKSGTIDYITVNPPYKSER